VKDTLLNKTVAFKTLGCRLNQYETEALASQFKKNGFKIVEFENPADVYIINSCTVTNQSDRKSRNISEQAYRTNKNALQIVTGCMSPNQKSILQGKGHVNYLIDNDKKSSLYQLVDAHVRGEILAPEALKKDNFAYAPTEKVFRTRSFVKVQDGCDNFCTFCIIPFVRGRAISRSVDDIVKNVQSSIGQGYKEVILTGVNIGRYQNKEMNFEGLLEKIVAIPGDFRIRISSLEPDGLTDKFPQLMQHPKITPHLHLCLQSGSDRILLKMKRMYGLKSYIKLIHQLRDAVPDINLTTDIMVGFPDETEKDFQASIAVVKELGFSHVHTFKYSRREGTRADRMPDQIPEQEKNRRSKNIREISEENKEKYFKTMTGKNQRVLIEKVNKKTNTARGYGEHYIPVIIENGGNLQPDSFVNVELLHAVSGKEKMMQGRIIDQPL